MVRQTSINCFNQIKNNGLLSSKRLEVLSAIVNTAPCTSAEAIAGIQAGKSTISQGRARFTELREMGVIYEVRNRKCSITGRVAIEWDLTGNLPVKPKKSNRPKNLNKAIDYIVAGMDQRQMFFIDKRRLLSLKK